MEAPAGDARVWVEAGDASVRVEAPAGHASVSVEAPAGDASVRCVRREQPSKQPWSSHFKTLP